MENEMSERKTTKEIAIFETEGVKLEVTISPEQDTVWLSRVQMAELFDRAIKTIGKHIANARHEELKGQVVVAKFATTTQHGAIQGKIKKEIDSLQDKIDNLEKEKKDICDKLSTSAFDPALASRLGKIEDELLELMEKWEEKSIELEKISEN